MRLLLAFLLLTQPAWAAIDFVTDDQVDCASPAAFGGLGSATYAVWMIVDTYTGENCLIDKSYNGISGGNGLVFSVSTGNSTFCRADAGAVTNAESTSTTNATLTTGVPLFLACAFDGTNAPNLYVGTLTGAVTEVSYASQSNLNTLVNSDANNLTIGDRDNNECPHDGRIVQAMIWNSKLTAAELEQVRASHNKRAAGQISASTLILDTQFNDQPDGTSADGDTLVNAVGSGNNCTGDDGGNNAGLTWQGDFQSYP